MPRRRVEFAAEALEEAEAAIRWYRERSPTAANALEGEIEATVQSILESPAAWVEGPRRTRRALLSRFPFAVVYREREDAIEVVAFAHGRRRPGYWRSRVKK